VFQITEGIKNVIVNCDYFKFGRTCIGRQIVSPTQSSAKSSAPNKILSNQQVIRNIADGSCGGIVAQFGGKTIGIGVGDWVARLGIVLPITLTPFFKCDTLANRKLLIGNQGVGTDTDPDFSVVTGI
jgi:hypothetical protein